MIVVSLVGGLGNQMFQYATGRRLAQTHEVDLVLDVGWFGAAGLKAGTPRHYELDCFSHGARLAYPEELKRLRRGVRPFGFGKLKVVQERGFAFDESVLRLPNDVHLKGYWQSEKYFTDARDAIQRDFSYREPPSPGNVDLLAELAEVESVGVHVRRGDYVHNPEASKVHGALPASYYRAAMAAVAERVPSTRFYVVSDDPEWCRANLTADVPLTVIDHNAVDRGWEDMRLLRACRHNVIANSSFSWWAAWLNPHPGKVIVAPRRWFADSSMDVSDIACTGWTLM